MRWFSTMLYRGRWFVIVLAVGLFVGAVLYGSNVFAHLDSNLSEGAGGSSAQAQHLLDTQLSTTRVDVLILFQNATLHVTDPAYQQAVTDALAPLAHRTDITHIETYYTTGASSFISRDGHETYATIGLVDQNDANNTYGAIRSLVHSPLLTISYGGNVPALHQYADQLATDLTRMETTALPLTALALLLVFDGALAALLPLIIGGFAIIGSLALLQFLTKFMTINSYAVNIVTLLGLGLAIDYALFIITRFREELAQDEQDVRGALQRTLRTAGRTVFFSGLTVSTSLIGLTVFPLVILRSLGIGAICAVVIAMFGALTILPALLAIVGKGVNALSLRRLWQRLTQSAHTGLGMRVRFVLLIGVMLAVFFAIRTVTEINDEVLLLSLIVLVALVIAWKSFLASLIATSSAVLFFFVLTHLTHLNSVTLSIFTIIELGAAMDFAQQFTQTYQKNLARNEQDVLGAMTGAVAQGGRVIGYSASALSAVLVTVTLLILPLVWHPFIFVAIGALLTATYMAFVPLPLMQVIFRRGAGFEQLFQPFAPRAVRPKAPRAVHQGKWYQLSQFIMSYPIPIMVATLALLIALGLPFLKANFGEPDISSLPPNQSARMVYERLVADFPQQDGSQQDVVVVTPGSVFNATNLATLNQYVQSLEALPNVTNVTSIVSLDPSLTITDYQQIYAQQRQQQSTSRTAASQPSPILAQAATLANQQVTHIIVTTNGMDNSAAAQNAVTQIRHLAVPSGMTAYVGGNTASQMDFFAAIRSRLPEAIAIIVLSTFLLLFLMTGSLVVPLKAVILNFLSLTATFGATVFIFQEGHGHNLLNFQAVGFVDPSLLVIVFAIAFGLSMDYEIFLLSRIKEQYDLTHDNRQSVAVGLQRTGGLITSVALLLAIVLCSTVTSQIIFIKQIGLGLAIAVIMDATIVRTLLLPATMRLLGKWNWWPNFRAIKDA